MKQNQLLRTKIVCTIGPASRDPDMLAELARAGMDVARLNFSHGTYEEHGEVIRRVRQVSEVIGRPLAILCDLQGPKLRVGQVPEPGMELHAGEMLVLAADHEPARPGRVPVQYEQLPQSVHPGDRILIDDGMIELVVNDVQGAEIHTEVVIGGTLTSNKGLNLPRASLAIPAITPKDREDLRFAVEQNVDWIALSFVRTADEVLDLRGFIRELAPFGRPTPIIPKIEKPEAVEHIDDIIAAADGIMVARGDLGIETSPEEVPMVQKQIIRKCNQAGKPVITATQMLDSMIRNPRPTRAEASDVANAILDGSDAIMLSGETAAGKYPVLAVQTMARIAHEVETFMVSAALHDVAAVPGRTIGEAVAHAAVETAIDLNAAAIVVSTVTGRTARTISRFRPTSPIVALTPNPITQRELVLFWGVYPILAQRAHTSEEIVVDCIDAAQQHGYAAEGDVVIVTAGSGGSGGSTNLMRVHQIERVLAHGTGLGEQVVRGRVRRLEGPVPADLRVAPDEIVVTTCTDKSFVPVLRRAAGLISASGGPDAHCHMLALELGIPAVIGVEDGIDSLPDGEEVTLNARRGQVYSRRLP